MFFIRPLSRNIHIYSVAHAKFYITLTATRAILYGRTGIRHVLTVKAQCRTPLMATRLDVIADVSGLGCVV